MNETTQRIINLQNIKGVNDRQLELGAGLAVSSIQAWTKGKNGKVMKPSAEAITKLSRYFNVSADYLLCLTDEIKPLKTSDISERPTVTLSNELAELSKEQRFADTAKIYNELPDEYRERIYGMAIGIAIGLGLNVEKILRR